MICIAKTKSTSGQFREYESRGRKQSTRPLAKKSRTRCHSRSRIKNSLNKAVLK